MRSTPDVAPLEFRVRFHAPVRRVRTISLDAAAALAKTEPEPKSQSRYQPQPVPKAVPTLPLPQPPLTPAPTFLPTDLEKELKADRAQIEVVLAEVRAAIASWRVGHDARLKQWQQAAIEMAMTTAARLLHERIVSGDFPIDARVRDMIVQLGEDVPVAVRLNPLDLELLKSRLERAEDEPLLTGPDAPRFVLDASLNRGECQVEGRESMLLSDVTRELQDIREDLLRSLDNARS